MSFTINIENWTQAVNSMLEQGSRSHVDRELYECELALNLHGVPTRFSCSGHTDRMPAFPYIIVGQNGNTLLPKYLTIMSIEPLSEKAIRLQCDILSQEAELGQNLLQLIDAFYNVRGKLSSFGRRLVIQAHGLCQYLLLNQGSIVGLYDRGDYLKEFVSFTTFLKDYLQ